jgi:hypothetical protein
VGDVLITVAVSDGTFSTSDQFLLTVVPAPIRIASAQPAGWLELSWPASAALHLETATNLVPPVAWAPLTNGVVIEQGRAKLTIPPVDGRRFFRIGPPPGG